MESKQTKSGISNAFPLPKRIADNIKHFTGRAWLLPPLLKWIEQSNDRLFILTGEPGSGKSMVSAWLAGNGPIPNNPEAKAHLEKLHTYVQATHFCIAASGSTAPKACAENLANQLTHRVTGFAEALAASLPEHVQIVGEVHAREISGVATGLYIGHLDLGTLTEEASFDQVLRYPLINLYKGGYAEPIILLIDALDEALTRTGHSEINLVQLLAKLDDLSEQVRVLVTTRPDPRVLKYFRKARIFDLINDMPESVDDVRSYINERLVAFSVKQPNVVAEQIADAAKDNFLYAHLVLGDLLSSSLSLDDRVTRTLPRGLAGLYGTFLNRELGVDEDRWYRLFRPVLGIIAVAQDQGLTTAQIEQITDQEVELTLRACKQYLDGELPDGPFRPFHRSFTQFLLEDEENADYHIDAARMHYKIAEHYWRTYQADWQRCDDYGLNNLVVHLFASHNLECLRNIINENWIHARYDRGSYNYEGFLADIELVWKAVEEANEDQIRVNKQPSYLAEEVRCALSFASVNSLVSNVPPSLVATLVKQGVWTPFQGLIYARRVSECQTRYKALTVLVPHLPESLQIEALNDVLATARQISDDEQRSIALTKLIFGLPASRQTEVLFDTVEAVRQLKDTEDYDPAPWTSPFYGHPKPLATRYTGNRSRVLQALTTTLLSFAPHLPESSLAEKLRIACEAEDDTVRIQTLTELVTILAALPHNSFITFEKTDQNTDKTESTGELSLSTGSLREISATQMRIGDENDRAETLANLSHWLPESLWAEATEDAFKRARQIEFEPDRAKALTVLVPYLPKSLLSEALAVIQEISPYLIPEPLAVLVRRLPDTLLPEALSATRKINLIDWSSDKAEALIVLASLLPEEVFQEAIAITREFGKDDGRPLTAQTRVLVALAPYLPEKLLREALLIATELPDHLRTQIFTAFVPRLPESMIVEVLHLVSGISNEEARVESLVVLMPRLPELLLPQALVLVQKIDNEEAYAKAIVALAPRLSEGQMTEVLAATQRIKSEIILADTLINLLPHLPRKLLAKTLEYVSKVSDDEIYADVLIAIALLLDTGLLSELLKMIQKIASDNARARVLIDTASYLPEPLLANALTIAQHIETSSARADVFTELALHSPLAEPLKSKALADAFAAAKDILVSDGIGRSCPAPYQASALLRLAPHLPEPKRTEALAQIEVVIKGLPSWFKPWNWWSPEFNQLSVNENRQEVLSDLIWQLPESLRNEIYDREVTKAINPQTGRGYRHWIANAQVKNLIALLPHLPEPRRAEIIDSVLRIIRDDLIGYCNYNCYKAYERINDMEALAPYISKELLYKAETIDTESALPIYLPETLLLDALVVAKERKNVEWLFALVQRLPDSLLIEAIAVAQEIGGIPVRAKLMGKFAATFARLSPIDLYPVWCDTLHGMASLSREEFLRYLRDFPPVITTLGGPKALEGLLWAIRDVGRWWP